MFIATLLITLMYGCLALTLAELAAAMPFTGGAYAYSRAVFGTWGGLLAGVSQILEYVAALATILVAIGIQVNMAAASAVGTDGTAILEPTGSNRRDYRAHHHARDERDDVREHNVPARSASLPTNLSVQRGHLLDLSTNMR